MLGQNCDIFHLNQSRSSSSSSSNNGGGTARAGGESWGKKSHFMLVLFHIFSKQFDNILSNSVLVSSDMSWSGVVHKI